MFVKHAAAGVSFLTFVAELMDLCVFSGFSADLAVFVVELSFFFTDLAVCGCGFGCLFSDFVVVFADLVVC